MRATLAFTLVVMAVLVRAPASGAPLGRLDYRNDHLTLRADGTPLTEVMDALTKASGAEVRGTAPDSSVTANLDDVPLREALERLLGTQSFTLTYADDGRLKTIELKGGPVEAKAPKQPEGPPAESLGAHDGKTPARWVAVLDALVAPVPVEGQLREKSGKENADWDFVLRMASQHDDPTMRMDAIRSAVRAVENHPEMRDAVVGALRNMDDEQLTEYVRAMARSVEDDPVVFVKSIMRHTRNGELRSRGHGLIRQFRAAERTAANAT